MHPALVGSGSHLSKGTSDLKQKWTQLATPFWGTVFHALSHGVILKNDVGVGVHFCLRPPVPLEKCDRKYKGTVIHCTKRSRLKNSEIHIRF